jgi:hypothetical protein
MIISSETSIDNDDVLVDGISRILIKEYDNLKDRTSMEKLVLKLGKKAYYDSIYGWRKNYKSLDMIKIKLHPLIERIIKIADGKLSKEESSTFRKLFENLTFLGYKNLQIYYLSTKDYKMKNAGLELSIDLINEAVTETEFYNQKLALYDEEEKTKNEIRTYFKDKRVKSKLSFYSFAFEYLDKIRVDIIKKDIEKMKKKFDEKKRTNLLRKQETGL